MYELASAIIARLVLGREMGKLSCACQHPGLMYSRSNKIQSNEDESVKETRSSHRVGWGLLIPLAQRETQILT